MRLKPKQNCVDCHFFVIRLWGDPGKHFPIEKPERDKERQGEYSWIDSSSRKCSMPGCYFDVWHKDYYESDPDEYHQLIVEKDQADSCFWWKYHPAMHPSAASTMTG